MPDDAYASNRFYISIEGVTGEQALFTEASGLQLEIEVFEYTEGGVNSFVHKLPGRTKVGNLTLKRGMTNSKAFLEWISNVALGKIERKNVSIVMFNAKGDELMRWNFDGMYPIKWTGPQYQASGNAAAIESLELAHSGLQLSKK
jgi:phage tail-like protein